jgi:beta-glucosidase
MDKYRNPDLPVAQRVEDLMNKMTLEEKIGQMMQIPANHPGNMEKMEEMHIGSYLHCTGDMMGDLQKRAEKTRLGIPLIFGIDAIHGHCFDSRGTVFPTQLAISSSWNRDLIKKMAEVTAREVRANGIHWTFSPVLCVGRDPRWGRIDETFGEDPWLIGELASEMIEGYQGKGDFASRDSILACAKHYAAYGETLGGRDSYEADISRRTMLSTFLPPFEKVVKRGCATLMAGYQSINGEPCSASSWLLRETAKEQWNLDGFIVTDWNNVGSLYDKQKVAKDLKEAAFMAITAGNDMIMTTPSFYENAIELVNEGAIDIALINDSVSRILKSKFQLGLFDNYRYPHKERENEVFGKTEHLEQAYQASKESLVLLKNEGILPINSKNIRKIALVGSNADDVIAQLGDWSFGSMQAGAENDTFHRDQAVTLLAGLRERAAEEGIDINFVRGADPLNHDLNELEDAVKIARSADLVIACVGDTLKLHGEFHDRANLDLDVNQQKLLEAVGETGTPLCVVLMTSKPLTVPWIKKNASALICAFNPGAFGGKALAELLFGDYNPSGKLTISFPHHVGQIPVYYNHYQGWHSAVDSNMNGEERYIDMPEEPLFVFGEGKSYTSFAYDNLKLSKDVIGGDETLLVYVDVTNTGDRAGIEIIQLYINDIVSSVTTPVKELRGFERIALEPGECQTVEFTVSGDDFSLINSKLERVVEPGDFEILVGSSSKKQDLLSKIVKIS